MIRSLYLTSSRLSIPQTRPLKLVLLLIMRRIEYSKSPRNRMVRFKAPGKKEGGNKSHPLPFRHVPPQELERRLLSYHELVNVECSGNSSERQYNSTERYSPKDRYSVHVSIGTQSSSCRVATLCLVHGIFIVAEWGRC